MFNRGFIRSKGEKLEVLTRVNERFAIIYQWLMWWRSREAIQDGEGSYISVIGLGLALLEGLSMVRWSAEDIQELECQADSRVPEALQ